MTSDKDFIPLKLRPARGPQEPVEAPEPGGWFISFLLFLALFSIFMVVSEVYVENYREIERQKNGLKSLKLELEDIQAENSKLRQSIEELKTSKGQEKIARQKLKLIMPDELIVEWESSQ